MSGARGWLRVLPGLYVSGDFVATRDGHRYWTLRPLIGWGRTLRGFEMPDYSDIVIAHGTTLAEVVAYAERRSAVTA